MLCANTCVTVCECTHACTHVPGGTSVIVKRTSTFEWIGFVFEYDIISSQHNHESKGKSQQELLVVLCDKNVIPRINLVVIS